jgi:hypothetical protein
MAPTRTSKRKVPDKKKHQNELIYYFVQANLINYMDFKYHLLVQVPIFVLGHLFILTKTNEIKRIEGSYSEPEHEANILHMVIIVALSIAAHYIA